MQNHFIIDRKTWARGNINRPTRRVPNSPTEYPTNALLNESLGTMCCLGFMCKQSGLPILRDEPGPDGKREIGFPSGCPVLEGDSPFLQLMNMYLDDSDQPLEEVAGEINDDAALSEPEREQRLQDLFTPHGITIEFIN